MEYNPNIELLNDERKGDIVNKTVPKEGNGL